MTVTLPTDFAYGKVEGRYYRGVADSVDADRLPDGAAAVGIITFTPVQPVVNTTSPLATVGKDAVQCSINSEGRMVDGQGNLGIWLFTGVWNVTYQLVGFTIAPHSIEVLDTHTEVTPLWLNNAAPAGVPPTPDQYAALTARLDTAVFSDGTIAKIIRLTQAAYDALPVKDPATLYIITA